MRSSHSELGLPVVLHLKKKQCNEVKLFALVEY